MTKARKVLAVLGLTAAVGAPVGVYAATRTETKAETKKAASAAKDETIICPITGEPIKPCCCPLNGRNDRK